MGSTSEFPPNCHVFLSIFLSFYLPPPLLFLFSSLSSHSSKWTPSMELWKAEEGTQFQAVLFPTDWTLHPLNFRKIQLKLSWSPEARSMVRPPRLQGHMALPLNSALWAGACYLHSLSFTLLPGKWGTNSFLTMLAVWHVFLARFPAQRRLRTIDADDDDTMSTCSYTYQCMAAVQHPDPKPMSVSSILCV